ncbi:TPA: hypothetical protein ACH3X1_012691 [Trebouxia sp. C0004]
MRTNTGMGMGNTVGNTGSVMSYTGSGSPVGHTGSGVGHHINATGANANGTGVGRHGHGNMVSSATKGAEYDATGGQVNDRTTMQKLKDTLTPGNNVGKHTKAYKASYCPVLGQQQICEPLNSCIACF